MTSKLYLSLSKSVCQTCGTINSVDGPGDYDFNKNVYCLNPCDHNFFLDFDATTYDPYDEHYHTTTLKAGKYCQFCKGTKERGTVKREAHDFHEVVDAQLGNNRFYIHEHCDDCGYETSEYITAKSVISSYYGNVDGEAHTLTVSDLSDSGVKTSIRYGTSAENCNLTSAPNFTKAGYNTVYYKITYSYDGESMTENGVSYVWLLDEPETNITILIPELGAKNDTHEHDYRYIETVPPTCDTLGYERWQCVECGALEKKNYVPAKGHTYEAVTIREATCTQGGLTLYLCKDCGDFYTETTPTGSHHYHTHTVNPTCQNVGYTEHICEICGDTYITDIQPLVAHSFERVTKEPTCTDKGYTTSTCTVCGLTYVSDYTEATGHHWDEGHTVTKSTCEGEGVIEYHCYDCDEKMIKATSALGHRAGAAATCTEPQICLECGTILELPTGHTYESKVIAPTCTEMGYTIYTCSDCGDTYTGDYTDKTEHHYHKTVTEPTCTSHGYTTYICEDCGDEYVSDYTEKLPHNFKAVVTEPTCTEFGFTTYTCEDCGENYVSDYTDKTPHNYSKKVVEPTCTEHGYTVYTCPDCGNEYIGDITECIEHDYKETVIAPTCTELGYSIFTCVICGDEYKSEYKEALGHLPSDWIIDVPATIEHAGEKHIECLRTGEILQTEVIPQLIDTDRTDEDGNAKIGNYSVILNDKDGIPVFNSEIVIDINDKISISLPSERLLDYADPTTVTVFFTETQQPAENLNIFIEDANGNNATGVTNKDGQIKFPNDKSNTGSDNGTIGRDDGEVKNTFVVTVTDKTNVTVPDCDVYIGESNNIVVKLPDGLILTQDSPAIITVSDQNGQPQKGVSVIVIADKDYIEKGITDMYGKLTVPPVNSGYTDKDGKVKVLDYNVFVNDENGVIENALVTLNEDNSVSVVLPADSLIDYANRITVTVLDTDGNGVKDISVTVSDVAENERTEITDESGKAVIPPVNEDMTDNDGNAKVNDYNITVSDENGAVENAFVEEKDGEITVTLPDDTKIDIDNRITVEIIDNEGKPVKDKPVTVTDSDGKSETNLTDENGKAVVPPTNIDYTDINGYGELDGYSVTVENADGAIEKAYLERDRESGNITVTLPENIKVDDYKNRVTVTVADKENKTPVKDIDITVKETVAEGEPKTASGKTDADGKFITPPLNEDITDNDGNSDVTETKTEDGKDTDGDGKIDTPAETVTTSYKITVSDTTGIIGNAFVKIENGKVYVTLPDEKTLTTSNQTTVTVLDKDSKPVKDVSVTVTDSNKTTATKTTDANGKITVPVKTSSSSGGGSRSSGGGGGGSISVNTTNITITDKDGKAVTGFTKTTDASGNVTVTLPNGKQITDDTYYTVTVTNGSGAAKPNINVTLKDKSNNSANGITDTNGIVILPAEEHKAYIFGYDDGTFRPENDMTRAEVAAIFARLVSEKKGEAISGNSSFKDVSSKDWYAKEVGYLEKYNIIKGYEDNTFRPNEAVTRAEFVSMAVRYYKLFDTVSYPANTTKYTDINGSHWAVKDISYATSVKWLNGYADGSFKPDTYITRAEVVTITNRATGRNADESYINKNLSVLNKFTDLKNNSHWAYYDIEEAANTHKAVNSSNGEVWSK